MAKLLTISRFHENLRVVFFALTKSALWLFGILFFVLYIRYVKIRRTIVLFGGTTKKDRKKLETPGDGALGIKYILAVFPCADVGFEVFFKVGILFF